LTKQRPEPAEGTRAFLQGIFGVGPTKATRLIDFLGDDAMRSLIDKPDWLVVVLPPAKEMTPTLQRSLQSVGLWHTLVNDLTHPLPLLKVWRARGEEWIEPLEAQLVLGRRLRESPLPDRIWEHVVDHLGSVQCRFEYRLGGATLGGGLHGVWTGDRIWIGPGLWNHRYSGLVFDRRTWWCKQGRLC
jgi:hypothetical protein